MSRKNTARTTARPATSTRKKAVASRRSPETAELAETSLEAAPSAAIETVENAVVENAVVENAVVENAVAENVVVEAVAAPTRIIARGEFDAIVRREAYLLAEARGFRQGSAFEDWIRAESAVHARLRAEGVSLA
jgi:hypothetical protein